MNKTNHLHGTSTAQHACMYIPVGSHDDRQKNHPKEIGLYHRVGIEAMKQNTHIEGYNSTHQQANNGEG